MIAYIRGELTDLEADRAVVEAGGVGYGIYMAGSAMSLLPPVGEQVKLHTYYHVKEDIQQLFGFLTRDDLQVFRLLIGVSGIGPKGALNILSQMTPDELRLAVMSGDIKAISASPGIGKKTAERLVVELRDKLHIEDVLEHSQGGGRDFSQPQVGTQLQAEAVQALVALGYGNGEALRAVRQVDTAEAPTVEELLKQALKGLV